MKFFKTVVFAFAMLAMSVTMLTAPAYAAPNQGCPDGWVPIAVTSGTTSIDANGDGIVCVEAGPVVSIRVIDNDDGNGNNGQEKISSCPEGGFEQIAVELDGDVDKNGDGKACQKTLPNGKKLVIDNNAATPASDDGGDGGGCKCEVITAEIAQVIE